MLRSLFLLLVTLGSLGLTQEPLGDPSSPPAPGLSAAGHLVLLFEEMESERFGLFSIALSREFVGATEASSRWEARVSVR